MKENDDLLQRIVELERQVKACGIRMGTVKKDEKGHLKVVLGKKDDGTDWEGPRLRKAQHHGFLNENVPFEEGQSVAILTQDGDFKNAIVLPYTYSEHDPLPEDAAEKKITRRIRKPREASQEQEQSSEVKEIENKPRQEPKEPEKQKDDDENDHYTREDYEGYYRRKGKLKTLLGKPASEDSQNSQGSGGQSDAQGSGQQGQSDDKGSGEKGEQVWHKIGDGDQKAEFLMVEGKIVMRLGDHSWTFTKDGIEQKVGEQTYKWKPGATEIEKGTIKHDKHSIDKTHRHKDVQSGSGLTGEPKED